MFTSTVSSSDVWEEQRVVIMLDPILESLGNEDASPKSFEQNSPAQCAMVVTDLNGAWINGRNPINKRLTDEYGNPYSWDMDSSEDGGGGDEEEGEEEGGGGEEPKVVQG